MSHNFRNKLVNLPFIYDGLTLEQRMKKAFEEWNRQEQDKTIPPSQNFFNPYQKVSQQKIFEKPQEKHKGHWDGKGIEEVYGGTRKGSFNNPIILPEVEVIGDPSRGNSVPTSQQAFIGPPNNPNLYPDEGDIVKEKGWWDRTKEWIDDYTLPDWMPGAPNKWSDNWGETNWDESEATGPSSGSSPVSTNNYTPGSGFIEDVPMNVGQNVGALNPYEKEIGDINKTFNKKGNYTVRDGDTFSGIIQKVLSESGHPARTSDIYNIINRYQGIRDPNKIRRGEFIDQDQILDIYNQLSKSKTNNSIKNSSIIPNRNPFYPSIGDTKHTFGG